MAKDRLDKFSFWVPGSFEKGTKEDGTSEMRIRGIASSATSDSDGEVLLPSGYDYSHLLQKGFLNWDHQAKKTSGAIVGEPTHAEIVNGGKDFYIEGYLYPNDEGFSVWNLAQTLEKHSKTRRLGFSIEGQVIERACGPEFLDEAKTIRNPGYQLHLWNKITKANITGVAITPCPKNPNTLMQIIKGETSNLLMNEDYEDLDDEDEKKKSISAAGLSEAGALPEDVEGTKNPNQYPLKDADGANPIKPTVGSYLKKSEIYGLIAAHYTTDVVKAKQIYSFIQDVNKKLFNMAEVTSESIQKAFDFLNKAASPIVKSEAGEEGKEKEPEEKEVEKSETDKAEAERLEKESKFNKAKDEAHELFKKGGLTKGEMVEALVKSGHSAEDSSACVASIISSAESLKENGGQVSAGSFGTGIEKSLTDTIGAIGKQDEFLKSLSQGITDRFAALGNILKGSLDQGAALTKQNTELQKSVVTLTDRLEKIENQPLGRKSVTTQVQAVQRFNKSANGESQELAPGTVVYDLQKADDRAALSEVMFNDCVASRERGVTNTTLEKAVGDLEISKSLPGAILPWLRSKKIMIAGTE